MQDKLKIWLGLCLVLIFMDANAQGNIQYLFKNKKEGYRVYRIPTIVQAKSGKLLAFCEGRRNLFDNGNIDLVLKTSDDGGITWSPLQVVWDSAQNTCGNPAPVVDEITGDIMVVATLNNDRVMVLRSKDEGVTWEKPEDITETTKLHNWKWYAAGPVHAIQLQQPGYVGRLVVPCNHTVLGEDLHVSHVIFSDDHGVTWQLGGSVPASKTDECTVAELSNGHLMLNMRTNDRMLPNRKTSISTDGGGNWSMPVYDSVLVEPICQGSLLTYGTQPNVLLFCNPMDTRVRKNLTLYVSYNNGINWAKQLAIHRGKSAYNDVVKLKNGNVLCIFETGKVLPYSGIAIKVISAEVISE